MDKPEITMTLDGAEELKELCAELPRRMVEKGLRRAANAAGTLVARAYRKLIDVRTGALKRAVKKKVKLYRNSETAIALVGIDKDAMEGDFLGKRIIPAMYQHLVEEGVKPHTITRGNVTFQHPGFAGRHQLRRAEESTASEALEVANAKLKETLEAEAEKLASKK